MKARLARRSAPAPREPLRAAGLPAVPSPVPAFGQAPAAGGPAAAARAAAFGHRFERLAPAAAAPIQPAYKDPDDPSKDLSRADLKAKLVTAGLPRLARRKILRKHGHKVRYDLGADVRAYASVYGTSRPEALGTYGTLVPIRSSKLRHPRRIYRELLKRTPGFSRNVAVQKLKSKADASKKIYLASLSLGLGVPQLELEDDPSGQQRKRSHSEAGLVGAHWAGGVKDQDDNEVDLPQFGEEYAASTNEFCQHHPGQQNCEGHLAPLLTANRTVPAYIGVKYSGGDDADQFRRTLALHDKRKKEDRSYLSEDESEDDADTPLYFINDEALRGKRIRKGGTKLLSKKILRNDRYHPYGS